MQNYIILLLTVLLTGCNSAPKSPTPFVISDQQVIVTGCEQLHKEVDKWNKANPDKKQKEADC